MAAEQPRVSSPSSLGRVRREAEDVVRLGKQQRKARPIIGRIGRQEMLEARTEILAHAVLHSGAATRG
ncbi:hypothetical protein [Microbacterium aurantiacum]|uniref:hypothetical protein n=1 Tax=Microbacterium aurantiacum TaxID=162393 RepID=UPI00403666AE